MQYLACDSPCTVMQAEYLLYIHTVLKKSYFVRILLLEDSISMHALRTRFSSSCRRGRAHAYQQGSRFSKERYKTLLYMVCVELFFARSGSQSLS